MVACPSVSTVTAKAKKDLNKKIPENCVFVDVTGGTYFGVRKTPPFSDAWVRSKMHAY